MGLATYGLRFSSYVGRRRVVEKVVDTVVESVDLLSVGSGGDGVDEALVLVSATVLVEGSSSSALVRLVLSVTVYTSTASLSRSTILLTRLSLRSGLLKKVQS